MARGVRVIIDTPGHTCLITNVGGPQRLKWGHYVLFDYQNHCFARNRGHYSAPKAHNWGRVAHIVGYIAIIHEILSILGRQALCFEKQHRYKDYINVAFKKVKWVAL